MAKKDYSQQDFSSTFEELLSIVEASTTKWNPRASTEADPGVVILKLMALLEDKANYRFDMSMAQAYLDSVSDRQSAFDLLHMLGYIMKNARAATGSVYLTKIPSAWDSLEEDASKPNIIPRATVFTDATGTLKFFSTKEVNIPDKLATNAQLTVPVQAGEFFQVTKDGRSTFSIKDIDEDGKLFLGRTDLAQNSIYVRVVDELATAAANGETQYDDSAWQYIDFAVLKPQGNWYMVETSEDGEMYIQFPDDFATRIKGSTQFIVEASCLSGASTNIAAGMLSTTTNEELKAFFSISQPDAFYTGQDAESIAQATTNYYATKDVCNTIITASDFISAIRYCLRSLVADGEESKLGTRYFSNVLVETAQDRALPVRAICNGQEFTLFEPSVEDNDLIKVIGLESSEGYEGSFARFGEAKETGATDIELFEADIAQQLRNQRALDAKVKIDSTSKRILAVTTPEMTIRMANYTQDKAAALKTKIQQYFYSTYRADLLTPGEALDYQRIVDDITALSPDILSVSMKELEYKLYDKIREVDGVEADTPLGEDVREDATKRAVLAGQVPLYRYANRQNTLSKSTSTYDLLADEADYEPTAVRPFGADLDSSGVLAKGTRVEPVIKFLTNTEDIKMTIDDDGLTKNMIVQFRKKLLRSSADYGYGIQYTCNIATSGELEDDLYITSLSTLMGDSVLAVGTSFIPTENIDKLSSGQSLEECFDGEFGISGDTKYLVVGKPYKTKVKITLSQPLKFAKGSNIKVGSKIAEQSKVNGEEYHHKVVSDGQQYQLKAGDSVVLYNSSSATPIATFGEGDYICPSGFALVNTSSKTLLGSMATLSQMVEDVSLITKDFKYFLSLHSAKSNLTLSPGDEYMLEEGELFVYADQGVTEYIVLGPGTILSIGDDSASITLKNRPFTAIEDVITSYFEPLPAVVKAQATEFTTYGEGKIFTGDASTITALKGDNAGSWNEITTGVTVKQAEDETELATFGAEYQCRLCWKIETDESGVATVVWPLKAQLAATGQEGTVDISVTRGSDSGLSEGYISSTVPFTAVLPHKVGTTYNLLSPGMKAIVSYSARTMSYQNRGEISVTQTGDSLNAISTAKGGGLTAIPMSFVAVKSSEVPTMAIFNICVKKGTAVLCIKSTGTDSESREGIAPSSGGLYYLSEGAESSSATSITIQSDAREARGSTLAFNKPSGDKSYLNIYLEGDTKIEITNLSYVVAFSKESGITEGDTVAYVKDELSELDTAGRFNPLCTPLEEFVSPEDDASFLNKSHPYNNRVLPFIRLDMSKIKVIAQR